MYESFPIYDFKSGLHLDKEPWLIPKDAFSSLKNAFIYKGVLQKRKGYSEWARFVHAIDDENLGNTVNEQLTYSGTFVHFPLRAGDLTISTADGGETFTDDGDGTLTGDAGGSGTINYTTGAWSITYGSNPGGGHAITADYDYYPELPIMGMITYYQDVGSSQFLIFDTKRFNKYDPSTGKLEDLAGSDIFTGADNNFFWFDNWKDKLFMTNNVDRVKIYGGSNVENLDIDYDGDETNDVDTCLLIFAYKGHLVLLRTTEKSTHCPHRARWSVSKSFTNWKESEGGGSVDCPTIDWIMAADFIGDDLVVEFERSIWILKYTGDPDLPFRWEQVKSTEGCYATFSLMAFSDEILSLGPTQLIATDGLDVYGIDKKIPDFSLNFNPQKFDYCYAIVLEEKRQGWLSYVSIGQSLPDSVLAFNYEENTWAIFDLALHCFGYFAQQTDLTWDDVESTWDEIEWSWDEKELQAGYPITLAGSRDGYIYKLNDGGSDNGANIPLEIIGGNWNPYLDKGKTARLGFIDFFVDVDPNIFFYVDFFKDNRSIPYLTKKITCDGDRDKAWKRAYCGAIGASHKIRIRHDEKAMTLKIHAITPWFKAEGKMI
jgi:hypothetical protein